MAKSNRYDSSRQWYAIHTYSGYEEKVAESIRQRAQTIDMADKIFDAIVPKEKQNHQRHHLSGLCLGRDEINRRNLVYRPQHARRYRLCRQRHIANSSFRSRNYQN